MSFSSRHIQPSGFGFFVSVYELISIIIYTKIQYLLSSMIMGFYIYILNIVLSVDFHVPKQYNSFGEQSIISNL
jgi:hypothetical protein